MGKGIDFNMAMWYNWHGLRLEPREIELYILNLLYRVNYIIMTT